MRLILTGWNINTRRQGFGIGREIDLGKSLSPVVATAETTARQARFVSAIILHCNINDDWNQGHAVSKELQCQHALERAHCSLATPRRHNKLFHGQYSHKWTTPHKLNGNRHCSLFQQQKMLRMSQTDIGKSQNSAEGLEDPSKYR